MLEMSTPTLVRVRPNRRILAKRRSNWLTRSPYNVPGSIRLTLIVVPPMPANGRFKPTVAVFGAVQLAARLPPWSLRIVPATCTSIFGIMYDPSAVNRVTNPVEVSHQGSVASVSGSASRSAQLSLSVFAELKPPCRTRPFPGRAVMFMLIEFATCVRSPKFSAAVWKLSLSRRSEEHTSELQSPCNLVCRLLLEKKKKHD